MRINWLTPVHLENGIISVNAKKHKNKQKLQHFLEKGKQL